MQCKWTRFCQCHWNPFSCRSERISKMSLTNAMVMAVDSWLIVRSSLFLWLLLRGTIPNTLGVSWHEGSVIQYASSRWGGSLDALEIGRVLVTLGYSREMKFEEILAEAAIMTYSTNLHDMCGMVLKTCRLMSGKRISWPNKISWSLDRGLEKGRVKWLVWLKYGGFPHAMLCQAFLPATKGFKGHSFWLSQVFMRKIRERDTEHIRNYFRCKKTSALPLASSFQMVRTGERSEAFSWPL